MRRVLLACATLVCGSHPLAAERTDQSVILSAEHAPALARQCSRANPPAFQSMWTPSREDIAALEARLPELQKLKAAACCIKGASVSDAANYFRQYVGLVVGGRRVIYINAFHQTVGATSWRDVPVVICDGGT